MTRATCIRFCVAVVLAVLGASWFEVDFSSSHQAVGDSVQVAGGQHPLPSLSALVSALTGGVVTSLPPWGVLSIATAYVLGRWCYVRWSARL